MLLRIITRIKYHGLPGAILLSGVVTVSASAGRAAARPGPRPGLLPLLLDQPDLATVQLGVVKLVQGPLHVGLGAELHQALAAPDVVSVGVHHLTGLPHVVLQVLPGGPAGEVLHDQLEAGPLARRVSLPPGGRPPAPPSASVGVLGLPGVFHSDPRPQQLAAVQVLHGILGVSQIIKLGEAVVSLRIRNNELLFNRRDLTVTYLEDNVPDLPKSLEELLHVPLPAVVRDVADVDLVISHVVT